MQGNAYRAKNVKELLSDAGFVELVKQAGNKLERATENCDGSQPGFDLS